ncbi:12232_t:CDS:2 [Entrophospora sp. SA101]|nr:12232_t:CDS:2 [Entrophospora sp. SA101]CAJ0825248.1 6447_t:CDS:2 [Entrophospora sp. SA101]CAJ0827730.1 14017_t:CDS:2 [Entrophospora sp. SA101]CAJ0827864.1 2200_t:CDS:2 [Entrophospora sp. SA101]
MAIKTIGLALVGIVSSFISSALFAFIFAFQDEKKKELEYYGNNNNNGNNCKNKIYPVNSGGNIHHHTHNLTEYEYQEEKEENMSKSNHYNQYPFLTDGLTDNNEVSNVISAIRIISNINNSGSGSKCEGEQNSNDHSYIVNNEYEDNPSKFGYYLEGWDYTNNDEENENELYESDYDESDELNEDEELDYDELELIMEKILACENNSSDENLEYSDYETETEDEDVGDDYCYYNNYK